VEAATEAEGAALQALQQMAQAAIAERNEKESIM